MEENISPQDPAICAYSGLPSVESYSKRDNTTVDDIRKITKEIEEMEKKILELEDRRFKIIVEGLK